MYYVPAQYPNAYNFIFSKKDAPILNPNELMDRHPYAPPSSNLIDNLPPEIQKKLLEYRKSSLNNQHKYKWTSYRDCPFVKRDTIQSYRSITGTGWYIGMYKVMLSIAATAIRRGYPITSAEIGTLVRELDADTGGWYKNRPIEVEASRAIAFALKNI